MKTYYLTVLISLSGFVSAQNISGTVTDQSGIPLPGCNIYFQGTYFGTSTNSNGYFSFEIPQGDSAIFVVEFVGYEGYKKKVPLKPQTIDVTLTEAFNRLDAVTVTAGTYGSGEGEKAVVLNSLDVVTTAGALGDVTGAMQTLPGTATNGESGRLFVHGGSADETGTYIDGILVHQPYTSSAPNMAVRGRFNPFMFSGTAFSTGGYSAEYGQALSSVLVLNTNEMPEESSLNIGLMTIGADLAGTTKWNNGAITASANYMNLSPYMNVIPQNYNWDKEPESIGGGVSLRQKTKYKGMFKLYVTADESNLTQQQNILGDALGAQSINVQNKNRFINTNWKGLLSPQWIVKLGGSYTYNQDKYAVQDVTTREELQGAHGKLLTVYEANDKTHFRFGGEYFLKTLTQSANDARGAQFTDHKGGAFAEVEMYLNKKLVWNLGFRGEYSSYLQACNFSPRFSMAYKTGEESQFSLAYGWFYQDPINKYLLVEQNLSYEKATHYILSYQSLLAKRTFRAEIYYKDYTQLIKYTSALSEIKNNGHGYAYGFDLYLRDNKTIKNGDYWLSYSYTKAERDYLNYPTMANPSYANTHNISLVYKHWITEWRSQIGATFMYGSPRSHHNPNNENFMDEQLESYKSLDINWSYLYRENIIFYVSVTNVLGFENNYGYTYSPIPNDAGQYSRSEVLPAAKRFFFLGCFITLSPSGTDNQLDKLN